MPTNYDQTVVQPFIPLELTTPLELWILMKIFNFEYCSGESEIYLFTQEFVSYDIDTSDGELMELLKEDDSPLAVTMRKEFEEAGSPEDWDLGSVSYVDVFQAIINRHPDKLPYVHLETAHTCSRMCPGEFGGSAEIITATQVQFINTARWLREAISLVDRGLPLQPTPGGELVGESARH
ncbi:hypothetical protein [Methylobacterium oryzisoli]|uniref:hypothetical protein n=1 Tax=Methylobacterium oryzisoli TaxID=3385502 RepID=UPI00389284AB